MHTRRNAPLLELKRVSEHWPYALGWLLDVNMTDDELDVAAFRMTDVHARVATIGLPVVARHSALSEANRDWYHKNDQTSQQTDTRRSAVQYHLAPTSQKSR